MKTLSILLTVAVITVGALALSFKVSNTNNSLSSTNSATSWSKIGYNVN